MSKLYEEVNPFQYTAKSKMNVDDPAVRDNINSLLTNALMSCTLTPYIALEKVRKVLAYFHISIPGTSFMEGDRGIKTFDVEQFGLKYGMKDNGSVVNFNSVSKDMTHGPHTDGENFNTNHPPETKDTNEKFFIYFEYKQNDKGLFDIFSEIVTQDELDDLLDDAEEDINDDEAEYDREDRMDESVADKATRKKSLEEAKREAIEFLKEMKLVGNTEPPTGSQIKYFKRQLRTPKVIGPPEAIKNVGPKSDLISRPDLETVAARSTTQSGNETPGTIINPRDDIEKIKKVPEQKPMSSAEMKDGGYQEKITETSHETVNHVRRLAMKNKRNDR